MTLTIIVCGLLLLGACVFGIVLRSVRAKYLAKIRGLRRERLDLDVEIKDLNKDIALRELRVKGLVKEVEALEEAKRKEMEAAADIIPPTRSVVDVLQNNGVISAEDVLKARTFLESSKSESTEEEALMILGIVTAEQMQAAKAELG